MAGITVGRQYSGVDVKKPFWHEVYDTYPRDTSEDTEYSHYYVARKYYDEEKTKERGAPASDLSAMRLSIALRVSSSIRKEIQKSDEDYNAIVKEPLSGIKIIGNVGYLKKVLEKVWGKATINDGLEVRKTQDRFHHYYWQGIPKYHLDRISLDKEWPNYENSKYITNNGSFERYIESQTGSKKGIIIITKRNRSEEGYLAALWDGRKLIGNYNMREWLNKNDLECYIYFWELPVSQDKSRGVITEGYDRSITLKSNDRKYFLYAYFNEEQKDNSTFLNGFIVRMEVASASEKAFARREFSMIARNIDTQTKIELEGFPISDFLSAAGLCIDIADNLNRGTWIAGAAKAGQGITVFSMLNNISASNYGQAGFDGTSLTVGIVLTVCHATPAVGIAVALICAVTGLLLIPHLKERDNAKNRAYKPDERYKVGPYGPPMPQEPPKPGTADRLYYRLYK